MAKSNKSKAKNTNSDTKVRVLSADTTEVPEKPTKPIATTENEKKEPNRSPLAKVGGYLKGSWQELKNVRWPDRKATWSMVFAILIFSAFFILLITLLDIGFDELFKLIIK